MTEGEVVGRHHRLNGHEFEQAPDDGEAETPILGHLMQRTDSLQAILMIGKIEGRPRRGNRG